MLMVYTSKGTYYYYLPFLVAKTSRAFLAKESALSVLPANTECMTQT